MYLHSKTVVHKVLNTPQLADRHSFPTEELVRAIARAY